MVFAIHVMSWIVVGLALVWALFTDVRERIITNEVSMAILGACVLRSLAEAAFAHTNPALVLKDALIQSVEGAAAVVLILLVSTGLARLFGARSGIGGGDIKLLVSLGAFLGWEPAFVLCAAAGFLHALLGAGVALVKKAPIQTLPMAPAIVCAVLVTRLIVPL